ncbi:hypothetical protein I553_4278 [Mycobacterium xenopi 4042]|uniref:Uncharacterized protein n=1 Tax=Mycobacterium xenopi 4042 TaxID=1299334 RepID=X8ADK3_MYCXE|nr:hypothetical protein I553_4278 [Mycobacterium xenopi 4042]
MPMTSTANHKCHFCNIARGRLARRNAVPRRRARPGRGD